MNAIAQIKQLLGKRIGVIADTLGPAAVEKAVAKRCEKIPCKEAARYRDLLLQKDSEIGNLIDEIVVPESWFFRDTVPFQRLSQAVAARTLSLPIRALSAPCAGGEEPYSIAMTLLDLGVPASEFFIKGVDISERLVSQAGKTPFSRLSFRGDNLEYRDKYFTQIGNRYQIQEPLRGLVQFEQANLTAANLLADDSPYDVIFCRNVMIYLDEQSRQQVLQNLDRLLAAKGILFVGHAEAGIAVREQFSSLNWPGAFAFLKQTGQASAKPAALGKALAGRNKPKISQKPRRRFPSPDRKQLNHKQLNSAKPRGIGKTARKTEAPSPSAPEAGLDRALRLADAGQNQEARRLCQQIMETEGPSAAAYFLLGNLQLAEGKKRDAEQSFERVVYLEPEHHEAITCLFHLASSRGDLAAYERWKRRLDRVATRSSSP